MYEKIEFIKKFLPFFFRCIRIHILCFQLFIITSPLYGQVMNVPQSSSMPTTSPEANARINAQSSVNEATNISNLNNQKENCNSPTQRWDSELNSCVTKEDAVEFRDEYKSCANDSDPQKCYLKIAEDKTNVKAGDSNKGAGNTENIGKMIAGAYTIFSAVTAIGSYTRGKRSKSGTCTSKWIFWGTSVAWIAGDLWLKHNAKKKFKEIAEKYEKEATNEDIKGDKGSYSAQVRAFNYLKEEQEQIKKQADYRKKLQIAVLAGFGLSAGFAAYETFNPGAWANSACKRGEPAEMSGAEFGKQVLKIGTSPQILITAGIMVGLTAFLAFQANREKKRAEDNIKEIDKVLATYSEYLSGFCPDGREDLNNARCYCYTEDGNKNLARTNSVICQNLFAADEVNLANRSEKTKELSATTREGCITVQGQFDLECRCREMKNTDTGQNACAQAPTSTLITGGFGAKLGAPDTIGSLNKITNGANKGIASLDSGALKSQAAKNNKALNSVLNDAKKSGKKVPNLNEMEKEAVKLMVDEGEKSITKNPQMANGFPSLMGPGNRPPSLAKEIAKAEQKYGLNLSGSKNQLGKVGSNKKKSDYKFNWNDGGPGSKVQNYMKKDYDYKDNDIVNKKELNIWNVISKRYQTSGLRRLFDDKSEKSE